MLSLATVPMLLSASVNLQVDIPWDYEQIKADSKLLAQEKEDFGIYLEWKDESTAFQWYLFWTIQALDVYSTQRGLKYDCIKEGNPLLGERPSVGRMVTHKTVFLAPYWMLQHEGVFTRAEIDFVNFLGSAVVISNFNLLNKAKTKCTKR